MARQDKENGREGVRLLKEWKAENSKTAVEMAALLGYEALDSYFRICRYEYSPSIDVCTRIARIIARPRAWVLDHWASEVARRKATIRRAAR